MEEIAAEVLGDGYGFSWSGQAFEEKKSGGTSNSAFVFGLIMVFLILAAQYEKWSLPIGVMLAVPFAICGALLATWGRGLENDVYFQVGLVTLIGLSAKNAILIIEFAVENMHSGMSTAEAAIEAARARLRPIVMTSSGLHSWLRTDGDRQRSRRQQSSGHRHRCYWRHACFYRRCFVFCATLFCRY